MEPETTPPGDTGGAGDTGAAGYAGDAGGAETTMLDVTDLPGGLRGALEAVLMVVDDPIGEVDLAAALQVPLDDVRNALLDLETDYARQGRGYCLRSVGGGWRFYSRPEYAAVVERFLVGGQRAKLTQAALETLAVIAYRQPVSRGRVGAVRGVNVDSVVRTLITRGLIEEVSEDRETGAVLLGTTPYFLERIGLSSLAELPALAPYLPDVDVLDDLAEEGRG